MIEVKINDTPYKFPTSWNDITFSRYCEIIACEETIAWKRICFYLNISEELFNQMNVSTLLQLMHVVEFMDTPDFVYQVAAPYENKDFNIGHEAYEKMEKCKQLAAKAKFPVMAGAEIVKEYTGADISNWKVTEVINQVAFFLTALQSS